MAEDLYRKYVDPAVLARLMAQPFQARMPMEGTVSGYHKSPHRGSSVEFAEYRNYVPGDDLRRLDWRVLARTDRYYMKEFEAETNLRCFLVLDCSGSMGYRANDAGRMDLAKRLIATLSYLILQQGDAIGLVCVNQDTPLELPARRNPSHMRLLLEILDRAKPEGPTHLIQAVHHLAEKIPRRTQVIIFSDCFCEPKELLNAIQHLRFHKHDITLFHMLDRTELEFRFDRPIRFVDLESTYSLISDPSLVRDEYLRVLQEYVTALRSGCLEFKVDYRQITTDQKDQQILADYLIERALLGQCR